MAYKNKKKVRKEKHCELEKLAFKMGCISRGLKNPNSLVRESYNNGLNPKVKEKKPKRTVL